MAVSVITTSSGGWEIEGVVINTGTIDLNGATAITSNTTNITLTPDAGTLDTGTVTAIVYYYSLVPMTNA